uniref:Uncharacterized protein n=1 Tax=Ditylenchus dipsaci TaxID=166011 RepID=A0A915EBJ0_9BILA
MAPSSRALTRALPHPYLLRGRDGGKAQWRRRPTDLYSLPLYRLVQGMLLPSATSTTKKQSATTIVHVGRRDCGIEKQTNDLEQMSACFLQPLGRRMWGIM